MEVTVKKTIWIDEEEIAKSFLNGTFNDVLAAVDEYCAGLDDCDYYALDDNAYEEIKKEVEKIVTNRKKGENKMLTERDVNMEMCLGDCYADINKRIDEWGLTSDEEVELIFMRIVEHYAQTLTKWKQEDLNEEG